MSVEKILEQRQKAYQDSLKALEILIEIKKSEKTELNADTVWQNEADEYKKGIQALNHIGFAEEKLAEKLETLNGKRNKAFSEMEYALGLVFKQNGAGSLIGFEGELPGGQLSDCTGYANNRLESYFDQENIREIFSRDAVSWLNGIKNRNSQEILKLFSYAYYYEFGGRVNLFNNSQHQNLLDTQGGLFSKSTHRL